MFQRITFFLTLAMLIGFSACQNEGEEPNPSGNEYASEYLQEVNIDGEIHIVDLTPPPVNHLEDWEVIGYIPYIDENGRERSRAIWFNNTMPEGSSRYGLYDAVRGWRFFTTRPS